MVRDPSSITESLNFSSLVRNSKICGSSSNTLRFVILSGMECLKINSIEHLLLVRTSLATEVANKSVAEFFNLGIDMILNASKFVIRSHTSFP